MFRRYLAFVALPLLALAAPPLHANTPDNDTIRIGVTGPFTGGSAQVGESMRNGIRLAAAEINQIGGINGKRIELIERDDEAKNDVGGKIAQEMTRQKVVASIGIVNLGVGLASIDLYQQAKIPLIIAASTGPVLTKKFAPPAASENYIFRVSPTLNLEAKVLVAHLKKHNYADIAIIADSTPYGDAGLAALRQECKQAQISIDYEGRFNIGDQDMNEQVKQGKNSPARAVIGWGIGPEMVALAKSKQQAGWHVPLLGGWSFSMRTFLEGAAGAGDGVLTTSTFIQDAGSVGKNAFLIAYQHAFKTDSIPSPMGAAQGYDGMHLLARAISQAGSQDGSKIRLALENLRTRYEGAISNYNRPFSAQDHDAMTQNMILMGKVDGGRVVYANRNDEKRSAMGLRKEKVE